VRALLLAPAARARDRAVTCGEVRRLQADDVVLRVDGHKVSALEYYYIQPLRSFDF